MDYDAMKLFLEAAELGSLSKVAAARGLSQPQVSRRISDLEQACGGSLFLRTGRGVALSELGQRIAPKVRSWIAATDQLSNDIQTTAGKPIGTVRIGILPSTAHPLVSTLYYRLRERFPLVQLHVREGLGATLEHWLEDGTVDLAILYRFDPKPRSGDVVLKRSATFLIGPAGDALTAGPTVPFRALHELPLITFCRPNSWRDTLDRVCLAHGVSQNIVAEADSLILQMHVVADGGAYALLGPYATAAASGAERLQAARIVEPDIHRHIALAMSPHGELTLAARTVMQLTREIAKGMEDGAPRDGRKGAMQ